MFTCLLVSYIKYTDIVIPRSAAATYTFRGSVNSAKEQDYKHTLTTCFIKNRSN